MVSEWDRCDEAQVDKDRFTSLQNEQNSLLISKDMTQNNRHRGHTTHKMTHSILQLVKERLKFTTGRDQRTEELE